MLVCNNYKLEGKDCPNGLFCYKYAPFLAS